jgi:uncharacterized protein (DUF2141 family)
MNWTRWSACLAVAVAPCTLAPHAASAEDGQSGNVIAFKVITSSDKGVVRCGLFRQDGWLKDPVKPAIVKVHGRVARCVFRDIGKGRYGISAFHDENNNGKLDTNFVGYPVEPYCASNNARNMFGPPSWSDAQFLFKGGRKELTAHMR